MAFLITVLLVILLYNAYTARLALRELLTAQSSRYSASSPPADATEFLTDLRADVLALLELFRAELVTAAHSRSDHSYSSRPRTLLPQNHSVLGCMLAAAVAGLLLPWVLRQWCQAVRQARVEREGVRKPVEGCGCGDDVCHCEAAACTCTPSARCAEGCRCAFKNQELDGAQTESAAADALGAELRKKGKGKHRKEGPVDGAEDVELPLEGGRLVLFGQANQGGHGKGDRRAVIRFQDDQPTA
ncbi:hypothetical protein FN846DRAFT_1013298 [Sphaerosporella brunnea]|uniref:Uncharacterized protein n=1 Tax=Sphaerosporella brunnea TaxID=1250544 RepID=A0A5J5EXF6_9PEZI|nr:hypothetical protein FN846DRAFT_1013298 [Sphaerosporella brunnea]